MQIISSSTAISVRTARRKDGTKGRDGTSWGAVEGVEVGFVGDEREQYGRARCTTTSAVASTATAGVEPGAVAVAAAVVAAEAAAP